jgi:hypothetical protein
MRVFMWSVGFEDLTTAVTKSTIFWYITTCSQLKVNRRFGGTHRLHLQGQRISRARNQRECRWQASYCSTLKMEAISSAETSIDFQRTTRRYVPEYSTLNVNCSLLLSDRNLNLYKYISKFSKEKIVWISFQTLSSYYIWLCVQRRLHDVVKRRIFVAFRYKRAKKWRTRLLIHWGKR